MKEFDHSVGKKGMRALDLDVDVEAKQSGRVGSLVRTLSGTVAVGRFRCLA